MKTLAACALALVVSTDAATGAEPWKTWLKNYGIDEFVYPSWIQDQRLACHCDAVKRTCQTTYKPKTANELSFCVAKEWMLNHMPEKDLHYLPPANTVQGTSMLDDSLVFSMMADKAAPWTGNIPLDLKHSYILPHADLMESVQNWRGLFFSKFFELVESSTSTTDAIGEFIFPNKFLEWNANYTLKWHTGTSPPVIAPFDFIATGYGSCSAWSSTLVYTCRALGIPARVVGSGCWNTGNFKGLATENKNLSLCWNGGHEGAEGPVGGPYLWNHNWVEIWDNTINEWSFVNAPPGSKTPNVGWQCTGFDREKGCSGGAASYAMLDHPVFAFTWNKKDELKEEGGEIVLGSEFKLTDGTPASPLVWSPHLSSALGVPVSHALRMVNRTDFYRNKH